MDFMILPSLEVYDSPILISPMRILRLRDFKRLAQDVDLGKGAFR